MRYMLLIYKDEAWWDALTAAEQHHVAQQLCAAHAGMALWRACKRKACGRRRRCGGDVDPCGARCSPNSSSATQSR